eukprot:c36977_g1_i2 orf=46-216(+)
MIQTEEQQIKSRPKHHKLHSYQFPRASLQATASKKRRKCLGFSLLQTKRSAIHQAE